MKTVAEMNSLAEAYYSEDVARKNLRKAEARVKEIHKQVYSPEQIKKAEAWREGYQVEVEKWEDARDTYEGGQP